MRTIWGDSDHLAPASHARGVRAALAQARIEVWPGMGHHLQEERPRALADFVEQAFGEALSALQPRTIAAAA